MVADPLGREVSGGIKPLLRPHSLLSSALRDQTKGSCLPTFLRDLQESCLLLQSPPLLFTFGSLL